VKLVVFIFFMLSAAGSERLGVTTAVAADVVIGNVDGVRDLRAGH
jgi:hypothetical protein